MKIHDVAQGTREWLELRSGIPTASEFGKILTPTGKLSESSEPYMHALIAERLMGHPRVEFMSTWMNRGNLMESEAVGYYEFQCDCETETIGFVTNDEQTVGASPDRTVGEEGLLEIKVPKDETHVGYLLRKPADKKYYPQLQGQLWITGRKWVDILSYHPEMPMALVRVERDEAYIESLSKVVTAFSNALEEEYAKLVESGVVGQVKREPRPVSLVELLKQSLIEINRAEQVQRSL